MIKVDFGGAGKGGEWTTINLDGAGNGHPVPDIVADITAAAQQLGKYFEPGSIDEAQCIHTLEHLIPWNVDKTLVYWRSFMKPGAKFVVHVPDIACIFEDYRAGRFDANVLAAMLYGPKDWQWRTPWENHRWGWDEATLRADLEAAGFHDIQRVEEAGVGFVVDGHHVAVLCMEAIA